MARDSRKPHVCFVSEMEATYCLLTGKPCGTIGGAELQQALIASGLRKLRYPVTFVVQDFGQPPKVVLDSGITLVKAIPRQSCLRVLRYFRWLYGLFKAMDAADADIYCQHAAGPVTGVVALYYRLRRKPFVFLVASNMDLDGTSTSVLSLKDSLLYRYGLKHATAVTAQTDDQVRMLKESLGRDGVLIRNTFSLPAEAELEAERKHILWVGTIIKVKRPEMFLELAARLPQYRFVMVGGARKTEQALFDEITQKAKDIPNLDMTGFVPYDEVGAYFGKAHLLINTSSIEGFPNTYVQAWCRGVPIVATFDADHLITRYGLGRYCSGIDELVRATEEFMQDDALRSSISEQVVRYVEDHHSPHAVAAQYDRLFTSLCQGRPAGR